MKEILKKISQVGKTIFGYSIMLVLFAGGATFFGYVAALIIGGEPAERICEVIYKEIIPVIVYLTTATVLFGLLTMYLSGEQALTSGGKTKKEKREK